MLFTGHAYKELTDSQIEALKSSKDLHDYQERTAEKSKAITDLERQIAAMRNDTTAATVAKRKQLEEQLAEAKKELEREQYEHSITEQENALNKEYENYENERNAAIEKLKASLEEREALIAASFETVKQNADIVGQEIALIAAQHGITISDAIISSWKNGETAIAGYGAVLSESTSAFIGNLMGVEYEVYNLQAQHGSLINTLEGGYNISSIMNALDGIAGGLNGVASAANKAASAIAAVGAAQAGAGSSGFKGSSDSSSSENYGLVDMNTGRVVESGLSKEAAEEKQRKSTGRMYEVRRMAKGGIVTKEKNNPLNSIAEAVGEDTIIVAKEGEGVFTEKQTQALIRFAESMGGSMDENGNLVVYGKDSDHSMFTSAEQFKQAVRAAMEPPTDWNQKFTVEPVVRQPEAVPNNANRNNNVTIHYDNMINIQGDVNDAERIINKMQAVAEKAIKKSWKDATMTLKYGTY
ncbi:hypothetical protein D3Z60_24560 [Lachnospiraceae bacterium]|jgi:hypothetical protein|nr:hypothetical protein [Lachnospiraceae bacterium]